MEELRLSVKDRQDARVALFRHYSSECVAHSVYLLTLVVAFLAFVEFVTSVVFPTLSEMFVTVAILGLVTSVFIILFVYVLGRMVFWGCLRSAILGVKPKEGNEVACDFETATVTFLLQLHEGCLDYVKKKHRVLGQFYG